MRDLSHHMVMPRFSEKNLCEELAMLIENYAPIPSIQLEVDQLDEKMIPSVVKETLYRIVQEQLSNIHKHAKATRVRIRLLSAQSSVDLLIWNNGVGFDSGQKRKGIGITNIISRAESYDGKAGIISQLGEGCSLLVQIPLKLSEKT